MNPIKKFAAFEDRNYAASTRRVYVSAAKKALKLIGKTPEDCESYEELLELLHGIGQKKLPTSLRIASFLSFLDSKIPKKHENSRLRAHPGLGN